MAYFKVVASAFCVSLFSGLPAYSEGEMPNSYLDGVAAKLIMAGFHDIEVIDEKNEETAQ